MTRKFLLQLVVGVLLSVGRADAQVPPATAGTSTAVDYSLFERPDLIRAIVEGDIGRLLAFKAGFLVEEVGVPKGLSVYLSAFNQEFDQAYMCPGALPIGLDLQIEGRMAQQATNPAVWDQMLQQMVEAWRRQPDPSKWGENLRQPVIAGAQTLETLRRMGQRDARILFRTGCESQTVAVLANGMKTIIAQLKAR
jgi:hypothetical protein